ncbi:hypothetical protein LC038_21690, partial [Epibacterium mobile]
TIDNEDGGSIWLGEDATLSGTGNTLNNGGIITVGDGGTVQDAGAINNEATGTITFTGSGTLNADTDNDGDGLTNSGMISTTDGGTDTLILGDGSNDTFTNEAGGTFAIGDSDIVTGTGTTMVNSGAAGSNATITLGTGSSLSVASLTNGAYGEITNAGTISTSGGAL